MWYLKPHWLKKLYKWFINIREVIRINKLLSYFLTEVFLGQKEYAVINHGN